MINRDVLDEAVQALLETHTEKQVGLSDVPQEDPTLPYYVLNQSPSPGPEGSLANREEMPYFDYMLKSVGRDHKETARTSSRGRAALVMNDITVAGGKVIYVKTISLGQIVKSPGPELFEVNDIYRICFSEDPS